MNIGARKALLFTALIALLAGGLLFGPATEARAENKAEIDRLFKDAQDLWEQGNSEGAAGLLKKLLAQDPSQETAYDLLRKAEYQMFLDILKQGGDGELAAKRLLELAHLGEADKQKDAEAIKALVQDAIKGEDYGVREKAVRTMVARHGEYAVPYLVNYLGSNNTDDRVHAILALSELSSDAVLPLTEALQSDNFLVQQNAAMVLKKLGDIRSVGGLLSLAARAENDAVKKAALGAAAKMGAAEVSAASAYVTLARKYYEKDNAVIRNYLGDYTVWKWKDGKPVDRQVPSFLYHLELAEECCFDALDEEPGNQAARDLLTAIHCAEWGAIDALPAEMKETEEVQELSDKLWNVVGLYASQGPDALLGALGNAVEWRDANVARGALALLPEVWDGRSIHPQSPMLTALAASDRTVRFAAAIAFLKIAPTQSFPGDSQVVPTAARAVDTIAVRQVLLVEPDAGLRTKGLRALDKAGFHAVAEATGVAGFRRAKEVGTFDVVVMRADLGGELALTIVSQLQDDFRTAQTPIIITADDSQMDDAKDLYGDKAYAYIAPAPLDVEVIKKAADEILNDEQQRARDISKTACDALATIDIGHTVFGNYQDAVPALASVLSQDKPEENRLAALNALAAIGTPVAAKALVATFEDTASSVDVRAGAAKALGTVYSGIAVPEFVFDALLAGLSSDQDRKVRKAVGDAYGEMALTNEQANAVLRKFRVE